MFRQAFKKLGQFVLVGTGVLILATQADAAIFRVKVGGGGTHSGASWANAMITIQDALDAAALAGGANEIWVASGTYYPTLRTNVGDARSVSFVLVPQCKMYGGFVFDNSSEPNDRSMRNPAQFPSILSGDLNNDDTANGGNRSDNAYHLIQANSDCLVFGCAQYSAYHNTTQVDGFTIKGGNADDLSGYGGGVYLGLAGVVIQNCRLTDNDATVGGGGAHTEGPYGGQYPQGRMVASIRPAIRIRLKRRSSSAACSTTTAPRAKRAGSAMHSGMST